jgi:RNA polymerase sigma-70 factor (ECF subfamily)
MSEDKNINENLLISELKNHNERAFRKLYDTYYQDIYKYSLSILKSKDFAEENVQEVFLKVWLHRENLNLDKSFKSFIFTIARNQAFNFLSKASNDDVLKEAIFYESQKSYDQGDYSLREIDCKKLKKEALKQLTPGRKKIFKMSRKKGMTYEEIGQELGISVNTVKNQMSKALETLRIFFQTNEELFILLFIFQFKSLF